MPQEASFAAPTKNASLHGDALSTPMFRRIVSVLVAVAAGAAGASPWADERRELQVCVCGGPPMCTDGGCYEPLQGQDCDNGSPPEQDLCADCSSCNTGAPTASRPPSGAPTEYFCYCSTSKPVCIEGGVDACYEPQSGLPCDNGSPPNNQLCDDCVTQPEPEPVVAAVGVAVRGAGAAAVRGAGARADDGVAATPRPAAADDGADGRTNDRRAVERAVRGAHGASVERADGVAVARAGAGAVREPVASAVASGRSAPSAGPSPGPSPAPSASPSSRPSASPTAPPSSGPTAAPSAAPTAAPSATPTTALPSAAPTISSIPTPAPSASPVPTVPPTHTLCDPGYYSEDVTGAGCAACPAGKISAEAGASACAMCPVNTYASTVGSTECVDCAAGRQSALGSQTCGFCAAGQYETVDGDGDAACVDCDAGAYQRGAGPRPDTVDCVVCAAGTYSAGDANSECAPCAAGRASSAGASACDACDAGRFANATGAATCDRGAGLLRRRGRRGGAGAVPAGTFSAGAAATACEACPAGTYAAGAGATACAIASEDTYVAAPGASEATACAAGLCAGAAATECADCYAVCDFCRPQTRRRCARRRRRRRRGRARRRAVADAAADRRADAAAVARADRRHGRPEPETDARAVAPPVRRADDRGPEREAGDGCETLDVSVVDGDGDLVTSETTDNDGQEIKELPGDGDLDGQTFTLTLACSDDAALADAYDFLPRADARTVPKPTPSPSTAAPRPTAPGFVADDDASECPAGTYGLAGESYCVDCPAGSYAAAAGVTTCTVASAGSSVPAAGSTAQTACARGTYAASTGMRSCAACPAGAYAPAAGAAACTRASAGFYVASDGATSQTSCASGTYSGSGASECSSCDAGTFAATEGASTCALAAAGSYVSRSGATADEPCAAGTYSGSGASECASCAAGAYGGSGASACVLADAGSYVATAGASAQVACPAGSFSGAGASSCESCPAGTSARRRDVLRRASTHADAAGASEATACAASAFSGAGATACEACPDGAYYVAGDSGCAFAAAGARCRRRRRACPAGTYSGAGASACEPCAAGTYSASSGATTCAAAAAGAYAASSGAGSGATECAPCDAGTFAAAEGLSTCALAAEGSYVDAAGASEQVPCAAGTYAAGNGASSCAACPAGSYSDSSGASSCALADAGYTAGAAASEQALCPAGSYSGSGASALCADGTTSDAGAATCRPTEAGYIAPTAEIYELTIRSSLVFASGDADACAASAVAFLEDRFATDVLLDDAAVAYGGATASDDGATIVSLVLTANYSATSTENVSNVAALVASDFEDGASLAIYDGSLEDAVASTGARGHLFLAGTACLYCDLGTFTPSPGATTCDFADAGFYVNRYGATSQEPCAPGRYAAGAGAHACAACQAGTYLGDANGTACALADAGSYAGYGEATEQLACAAGSSSGAGATACAECPAGTYSASGATSCARSAGSTWGRRRAGRDALRRGLLLRGRRDGVLRVPAGDVLVVAGLDGVHAGRGRLLRRRRGLVGRGGLRRGRVLGRRRVGVRRLRRGVVRGGRGDGRVLARDGGLRGVVRSTDEAACAAGRYSGAGASHCDLCADGTTSDAGSASCEAAEAGTVATGGETYTVALESAAVRRGASNVSAAEFNNDTASQADYVAVLEETLVADGGFSDMVDSSAITSVGPATDVEARRRLEDGTTVTTLLASIAFAMDANYTAAAGENVSDAAAVIAEDLAEDLTESIESGKLEEAIARHANGSFGARASLANATGATACAFADAGFYVAATGSADQVACDAGTYSNPGARIPCERALSGSGTAECAACAYPLTTSASGASSCDACGAGYYWDTVAAAAGTTGAALCVLCPEEGSRCLSEGITLETLPLKADYWRASLHSDELYACALDDACGGGAADYCEDGHGGPLCGVCDAGWTLDLVANSCVACPAPAYDLRVGKRASLAALAALVLIAGLVWLRKRVAAGTAFAARREKRDWTPYWVKLKIVVGLYQIVGATQWSMPQVPFPRVMTAPFAVLATVAVDDVFQLLPLDCLGARPRLTVEASSAYALFCLSFLCLPSCAAITLQFFGCARYDLGADGGDLSVLYADQSVDCSGARRASWRPYALLMVALYPVGVPLCYALLLWRRREDLNPSAAAVAAKRSTRGRRSSMNESKKQRRASMVDSAKAKVLAAEAQEKALAFRDAVAGDRIATLAFLVEDYRPQCFGFALFLALAVSLASHRVYAHYAPFVDDDDARLAEVANAELVLVFFACLALFVDGAGGASRLRLGSFATAALLLVVFFAGLAAFFVYVVVDLVVGREQALRAVLEVKTAARRASNFGAALARPPPPKPAVDDGYDDDVTTPTCSIVFKPLDGDAAEAEVSDDARDVVAPEGVRCAKALFKPAQFADDSDDEEGKEPPSPDAASFYGSPHDVEDRGSTTDGAVSFYGSPHEHREEPPSPVRVDLRAPRDVADLDRLDDVDLPAQL
ncbi:hypothetical protein JL722_5155 [Aureococcus anophagefferens]|nr:hypothetical protein JL722_5155 [Aureococcus anophagefferens]